MNEDRGQGALPKLYGAPAYARPPVAPANPVERAIDPDDLPLEAERTSEEQELVQQLRSRAWDSVATAEPLANGHAASGRLHGRPFRLRLPIPGRDHAGRQAAERAGNPRGSSSIG